MIQFACDIGGTRIKLGLVRDKTLLARREIPAEPELGLAAAIRRIAREQPLLCQAAGRVQSDVAGFALAFPGIIEPATDRILSTPAGKFEDARSLDPHELVRRELDLPAFIVNDANAALAGEWRLGAASGCDDVVMVTLGTGIGSSAIMKGVPVRGMHGQAGCLGGHLTVNLDGAACRCGNLGCAETEASTWALPAQARAHSDFAASALERETALDYQAVFAWAARGDRLSTYLRDRALRVWAATVVTLIHTYDPERVVIGGGIMQSGAVVLEAIRAYVARYAWTPWGEVAVVPAALGQDAGLLGVAGLAAQRVVEGGAT